MEKEPQTKVERPEAIRNLNRRCGLPSQGPNELVWNNAIFHAPLLFEKRFFMPLFQFTHPLVDYPLGKQQELIDEYATLIGDVNRPRTFDVGIPRVDPSGFNSITVETHEVNRKGYWTVVLRSVFLHQRFPISSLDIVGFSDVVAHAGIDNIVKAPPDIKYISMEEF